MKCHVCEGGHVYLTDRMGHIKEHIQCLHCKGTGEEPFDAQTELAELKRRVEALEQHKPLGVISEARVYDHAMDLSDPEVRATMTKPTLPERPGDDLLTLALAGRGCSSVSMSEASAIYKYIVALEKECGK
jgi:hypothetical protein